MLAIHVCTRDDSVLALPLFLVRNCAPVYDYQSTIHNLAFDELTI